MDDLSGKSCGRNSEAGDEIVKVSIITAVFNGERYIESCIQSVLNQNYSNIEHIIIDGASKDNTVSILKKYDAQLARWISEPDKGIYDAINKGIQLASGDVIGILNSDDFFAHPNVIHCIVDTLLQKKVDCVFGELVYINPEDENRVVRYYTANKFKPKDFRQGNMPPHPTFYARKEVFDNVGLFNPSYIICADFEWMIRVLYKGKASYAYIPEVLIKMRTGGVSTRGWKSTLMVNSEMLRACRENSVPTSLLRIYSKYFSKIWQLFRRPK